jgi:flavin reductase (DIM6/NTAB) family NADH-FMN oxidoreductase RutF
VASGVYIVTLEDSLGKEGMLATWISQSAFEPPMLSVAVNKSRPILERFSPGSKFVVNVLSKTNMDIFKNFAKPHKDDLDRFEGLELLSDSACGPEFKNCISCLSCEVVNIFDAGDHAIVSGKIKDGKMLNKDAEPMIHLRKDGFQY